MSKFQNRELSWISFNARVLEEACNQENPLLERGKFISICESNLDEFYMVRVGGLVRDLKTNSKKTDIAGLTPAEQLAEINLRVRELVERQYHVLNAYLSDLADAGIHLLPMHELNREQRTWLSNYFDHNIAPLLTPRAIDMKRPFPLLAAKCLHLALLLPPVARGEMMRFALLPLPQSIDRVIMLPMGKGRARGVLLENAVSAFAYRLFGGDQPVVCQPFRLTRNTDFLYDDSNADTLIVEMRKNLKQRKWGQVVRLQVPKRFDSRLLTRLKRYLDITDNEVFAVSGPLNPSFFMKQIAFLEGFDDLRFPAFSPRIPQAVSDAPDIFSAIRQGDIFLHHPYDSFAPVIRFVSEAADDPNVMAIKQTLYRVSGKSPIVAALSRAARNGKQVTVLIEVRARFDEENNINWCLALEKAGCHVIYGVPSLKAHSKITLVIRREENGLKRYVHLGTGNYNDSTAKLYTDMGLFTADEIIGRDAGSFFNQLTGFSALSPLEKLCASPDGLRKKLDEMIDREIENAERGEPCGIMAKMNGLTDKQMIKHLYRAADAGVPVTLIVRGACCLKVKKHDNIEVRSIIGRFLEHARVYCFENSGEPAVFLSSADLMTRNLDKRVELLFPIENMSIRNRVYNELLLEKRDNMKAWIMDKDGNYARAERTEPLVNAQEADIPY